MNVLNFLKINFFSFVVMSNLTEDKSLREFWARCTDQNLLYIQPEKIVTCLDQKYGAQLKSKYERDPKRGKNCKIPGGF